MTRQRTALGLILSLLLSPMLLPAPAQAAAGPEYREGVAYQRVIPPQPTLHSDRVEVVEIFWYGCPHCHRFQPYLERWLKTKPDNVDYIRLPAILRESWAIHARAFYTAEALGVLDRIHTPLFDAIHKERRRLDTEEALMAFFAEHGVDEERFRKTFHSFAVDSKVRRARLMTRRYGTEGTPAVIINGKYRTGPGMVNSFEELIKVIDYLVEKETRALQG